MSNDVGPSCRPVRLTRLSIERPESAALDGGVADERDAEMIDSRVEHAGQSVSTQSANQTSPAIVSATLPQLHVVVRTV